MKISEDENIALDFIMEYQEIVPELYNRPYVVAGYLRKVDEDNFDKITSFINNTKLPFIELELSDKFFVSRNCNYRLRFKSIMRYKKFVDEMIELYLTALNMKFGVTTM
jgi:hypothetical protein